MRMWSPGAVPWGVLSDNEGFLNDPCSKTELWKQGVRLWHVPPRSPDLNPVEKFWAWLRRELRRRDLKDLKERKPALGKAAYRIRVRNICNTTKAKQVASNIHKGYKRTCREIYDANGAFCRKC